MVDVMSSEILPASLQPCKEFPQIKIKAPPPRPLLLFISDSRTAATIWLEISVSATVSLMKKMVQKKTGVPIAAQILVYQGEELKNPYVLKECNLKQHSTIHLLNVEELPPVEPLDPSEEPKTGMEFLEENPDMELRNMQDITADMEFRIRIIEKFL